jgi:hypothetical protein
VADRGVADRPGAGVAAVRSETITFVRISLSLLEFPSVRR